mmetsp:Transcript_14537/g.31137  ORF Transcript_14537/g.31137 Transcript_14537/m.31137 type:complete len:331 (-) Transcript_14537:338-1330(-)
MATMQRTRCLSIAKNVLVLLLATTPNVLCGLWDQPAGGQAGQPSAVRTPFALNYIKPPSLWPRPQQISAPLRAPLAVQSPPPINPPTNNPLARAGSKYTPNLKPVSNEPLRIVLVANGRSVLRSTKGREVDEHDLVGRFNFFKTLGFEQHVGSKVDLWFLGELKEPGPRGSRGVLGPRGGTMNMKIRPQKYIVPVVYPTPPACAKKSTWNVCTANKGDVKYRKSTINILKKVYSKYHIGDKLDIMPSEIERLLQTKYKYADRWPSSGILAIVYCMEMYPNSHISLLGYDFGNEGLGHYWEKILKTTTVHNMKHESSFLNRLIATGRVSKL